MPIPEHTCDHMPEDCVAIYCEEPSESPDQDVWKIAYMRNATEEDLNESSILENVGDEIWRLEAEIRACPYCGELLSEAEVLTATDVSSKNRRYFRLLDQEAWSIRIR